MSLIPYNHVCHDTTLIVDKSGNGTMRHTVCVCVCVFITFETQMRGVHTRGRPKMKHTFFRDEKTTAMPPMKKASGFPPFNPFADGVFTSADAVRRHLRADAAEKEALATVLKRVEKEKSKAVERRALESKSRAQDWEELRRGAKMKRMQGLWTTFENKGCVICNLAPQIRIIYGALFFVPLSTHWQNVHANRRHE